MSELTREIQFHPAYDKRHKDPAKNYGWGCARMRCILKGPKGAVQFVMLTGWALPHCKAEYPDAFDDYPMASDLGYHSPEPMYEGQQSISEKCDILGCECYYDGSTLNAEEPMRLLIEQGHEALWRYLEDYYRSRFDTVGAKAAAWTPLAIEAGVAR